MGLSTFEPDMSGDDEKVVAEINITPLTDIFLVLLIIFMVTSTALTRAGIGINLPEAKAPSTITEQKRLIVRVTRDGMIQVGDRTVPAEALEAEIAKELSGSRESTVVMEGDQQALLGQAVTVLDAAKRAGAAHISIATRPPSPQLPR